MRARAPDLVSRESAAEVVQNLDRKRWLEALILTNTHGFLLGVWRGWRLWWSRATVWPSSATPWLGTARVGFLAKLRAGSNPHRLLSVYPGLKRAYPRLRTPLRTSGRRRTTSVRRSLESRPPEEPSLWSLGHVARHPGRPCALEARRRWSADRAGHRYRPQRVLNGRGWQQEAEEAGRTPLRTARLCRPRTLKSLHGARLDMRRTRSPRARLVGTGGQDCDLSIHARRSHVSAPSELPHRARQRGKIALLIWANIGPHLADMAHDLATRDDPGGLHPAQHLAECGPLLYSSLGNGIA